ncbi:4'-phosphopantetheinyl transferase domain-containing protein [Cardiosporidium cionae]|uniref:4'-phosphopantetheinyl transferase domain-containing protein n=1 Tax=Cardiosporidium cionae TaxID=476202 RepID=A0ABQ7JCV8_9APIC|nr:4'-phosphopantetheinyl transferase domain-containing protein [Cardiosporidium cionae]|eukprot:KAF8821714.1 4'-phosphopantetheinyl transferase domain-containing protein [Cardiosporidium cionae]
MLSYFDTFASLMIFPRALTWFYSQPPFLNSHPRMVHFYFFMRYVVVVVSISLAELILFSESTSCVILKADQRLLGEKCVNAKIPCHRDVIKSNFCIERRINQPRYNKSIRFLPLSCFTLLHKVVTTSDLLCELALHGKSKVPVFTDIEKGYVVNRGPKYCRKLGVSSSCNERKSLCRAVSLNHADPHDLQGNEREKELRMKPFEYYGEGTARFCNKQNFAPIDFGLLERQLNILREILGISHMDVTINFITEDRMRELNLEYRQENTSTDILSFPSHTIKKGDEVIKVESIEDLHLGDIFISPEVIQRHCDVERLRREVALESGRFSEEKAGGVEGLFSSVFSLKQRFPLLLIHGLLHLLRYDHEEVEDRKRMLAKEQNVIDKFHRYPERYSPSTISHSIIGIGTDVCTISRFYHLLHHYEISLMRRILSPRECYHYKNLKKKFQDRGTYSIDGRKRSDAAFFAKHFAVKEAVSKALGRGLRYLAAGGIKLCDVELLPLPSGKPEIEFKGEALKIANTMGVVSAMVSLSDERESVIAFVILTGCSLPLL